MFVWTLWWYSGILSEFKQYCQQTSKWCDDYVVDFNFVLDTSHDHSSNDNIIV